MVETSTWVTTYYVLAFVFLVFGIIYTYVTRKNHCGKSDDVPGSMTSQVSYVIAVFVKSLGLMCTALLLSVKESSHGDAWGKYSVLAGGLPGYISGIAYCFIFFSWCSVCYEYIDKSARSFYEQARRLILSLTVFLCISAVVSMSFVVAAGSIIAHRAEAIIATFRDFTLVVAFVVYLVKIIRLFENPCSSFSSPEARLILLCSTIIFSLAVRIVSILLYIFVFYDPSGSRSPDGLNEFSTGYYFIFLVEFLLCEILPIGSIGLAKMSTLDAEEDDQEQNASFIPFQSP